MPSIHIPLENLHYTQVNVATVTSVIAMDSKEFNIPGAVRDFFCPIGVGIRIPDEESFSLAYRKAVTSRVSRWNMRQKRSVFDSYSLTKILGGQDSSRRFYEEILAEVKSHIDHVYVFYTTIYPSKIQKLFVYESGTVSQDPIDFLKEHKAGYVVLCGWKYSEMTSESERTDSIYLDFFEAKATKAWDTLKFRNPKLFCRGDSCNPSIAMADGVLGLIDRQLKRNYYVDMEKLSDRSVDHALRDLGLKGEAVFIGQPDLKKIIPYSRDQILTRDHVAHPIFFLSPEKRPEGVDNQQYREMIEYMPVMDALVERACDANGCVKFYDATQDYLLAREDDFFAFYGKTGEGIFESIKHHVKVKPIDFSKENPIARGP